GNADRRCRPVCLNPLMLLRILAIHWIGHDCFALLDCSAAVPGGCRGGVSPPSPRARRPRDSRQDAGATVSSSVFYKTASAQLAPQRPARVSLLSPTCLPPQTPA